MKCSVCNGTGKQNLKVSEFGSKKPAENFEVECIICKGSGEMTKEDAALIEFEKNMWCECKNKNPGDVRYYDNNEHPEISKHHWRCTVCKKVRQIG